MKGNSKFGGATPPKYGNTANLRGADPMKARRDWSGLKGPEARPRPQTEGKAEEAEETKTTKTLSVKRNRSSVSLEVAQAEPPIETQVPEPVTEPEVLDIPVTPSPIEEGDQQIFPL
jgi:hypothetical protein